MPNLNMNRPTVFISYSHKDETWKDRFKPQLDALERAGQLVVWDDRKIDGGEHWYPEIEQAMSKAAVAVCLISENYLASKFCIEEEIPFLLARENKNNMLLIPVLISPCPWFAFRWLSEKQMLPRDGKSIIQDFRDNWAVSFAEVATLIYKKINDPEYCLPVPAIKWAAPEKIDIDRLPQTGMELFGREKELALLDEAWESNDTNMISFIAWGGVGKSTLVNKWLEYMKADNYKNAERVFGWSFYSQGTNEQVSSADTFISEALIWFGDSDPKAGSAWDKGQRLAKLIRQKKTLLVLDGLEPLQSSYKFEKGKIRDQGLGALVRSLAMDNNGLCIITSRENLTDLSKYERKAPQPDLEKLSLNAGRALLRVGGVRGTDKELESAVEAFGSHALAVKLLAVYLSGLKEHHISDAMKIPDLNIPEEKGKHPRRVIEALCKRFINKPEGDLLRLLGFFDRPAEIAAVKKILEEPVIEGLTDNLCNKGEAALLGAIISLRNENLLAKESKHRPNTLDCHPLIREHFGEKLENENPEAWKEAHARLYEYYKNLPEKELPDTLEEMEPLFAAVRHGCLASMHQKALDDIYWIRIRRGTLSYITEKLGAFSADLSLLANFFYKLWDKQVSDLSEKDKALVLSWAGFSLSSVGLPKEAEEAMLACLNLFEPKTDKIEAAIAASSLNELYLMQGKVKDAVDYGRHSFEFAELSGDEFEMVSQRTKYANALHQAGNFVEAEILFVEADRIQQKRQPEFPRLYSYDGDKYFDLLFSMLKYKEVKEHAEETKEWVKNLLSIPLYNLTIGKALMFLDDFEGAENYLNKAVEGLRQSGYQDHFPRGLLARATFYRLLKVFSSSWSNLDEALEIAEYGQMRLYLTDYHLEAARLIRAQLSEDNKASSKFHIIENGETLVLTRTEMQAKFLEHFLKAEKLILETGYHRRDKELEELRKSL